VNPADGRRYPLRVGINTVGRFCGETISSWTCAVYPAVTALLWYMPRAVARCTTRRPGTIRWSTAKWWIEVRFFLGTCFTWQVSGSWSAWVGTDGEVHEPAARSESEDGLPQRPFSDGLRARPNYPSECKWCIAISYRGNTFVPNPGPMLAGKKGGDPCFQSRMNPPTGPIVSPGASGCASGG